MSTASSDHLKAALQALNSINDSLDRTSETLETTIDMVQSEDFSTQHGLTLLEVKNHTLEQYLMDLQFLMLSKSTESSTLRPSTVGRLIESRVVLEKLRPVETKLRFQIDKIIKSSIVTDVDDDEANLLQYKPRLENLVIPSHLKESDEDDTDPENKKSEPKKSSKNEIYRPPKLVPMPYEEEEDIDKPRKRMEAKKRAVSARIIQELKEDVLDVPVEITEGSMAMSVLNKAEKKRINFEESNYTRIPITKKDKQKRAMARNTNTLDFEFRDIGSKRASTKPKGKGKKMKKKGRK